VLWSKGAHGLWTRQHYTFTGRVPKAVVNAKTLMTYMFLAADSVSEISIDSCKQFGLNASKLSLILTRCKQLKHFKLRGYTSDGPMDVLPAKLPVLPLLSLHLGFGTRISASLLQQLLHASPKLQELSIFYFPDVSTFPLARENSTWPLLTELKVIRLADGARKDAINIVSIPWDAYRVL
jgi:hypothetical protein